MFATAPILYSAACKENASQKVTDFLFYITFRLQTEYYIEKVKFFKDAWKRHNSSL